MKRRKQNTRRYNKITEERLRKAYRLTGGDPEQMAAMLDCSRPSVSRRMRELGLASAWALRRDKAGTKAAPQAVSAPEPPVKRLTPEQYFETRRREREQAREAERTRFKSWRREETR